MRKAWTKGIEEVMNYYKNIRNHALLLSRINFFHQPAGWSPPDIDDYAFEQLRIASSNFTVAGSYGWGAATEKPF